MSFKKTVAIAAAVGALSALAIPAMAETSFYGSARLSTFYNMNDTKATTGQTAGFDEHLQTNSRFGVDFKNGDVGGKVEYGASGGANIRLLYGTWNFGGGVLTVGQDYNNYYLTSAQVHGDDNSNNGLGALWDTRQAQLKVKLNNGLYFAAIQPTGNVSVTATSTAGGFSNFESANGGKSSQILPKLNIGYAGKAGTVGYNVGVVGQTYKNSSDKSVNSFLGYAQGTAAFGATSLQGSLSFSQNAAEMGFAGRAVSGMVGTDYKNTVGFEGYLQATQKFSDTLSGNIGFGYVADKQDISGAKYDDKMALFINAPITLAKNVTVTPEFDYYDQLKDGSGTDQKKKDYAIGAKWQINF